MRLRSLVGEETWLAIESTCTANNIDASLLGGIIEARIRFSGAGNRRRLFAEFERLLDGPPRAAPVALSGSEEPRVRSEPAVQLRSLTVRNWKVFRSAQVTCPRHDPRKPIVLLGGKNGSGKTSLLEALLFGLYGPWAPGELASDPHRLSPRRREAYRKAIENAFHRRARLQGETAMAVTLSFDTADGPLQIDRRWYLGKDGHFIEEDEELILYTGEDGDILPVPDGVAPHDFYQDEIARRLLPPALAPFFFFDGEQVKLLGERRLSEQVRLGVECLLGVPVLRDTIADLGDYARDRLRDSGTVRAEIEDHRSREIADLEGRESAVLERLSDLEEEIFQRRARRDTLISDLGAVVGGSYADLQELLERRRRAEVEMARAQHALNSFAADELPLVLAGRPLLNAVTDRLRQEEADEAKSQIRLDGGDALEEFLQAFSAQEPSFEPGLEGQVCHRIRAAWQSWATSNDTAQVRHHYLSGRPRTAILERLVRAGSARGSNAREIIDDFSRAVRHYSALCEEIELYHRRSERQEDLTSELRELSAVLETMDVERRQLDRDLGEVRSALLPLRQESQARRQQQEAGAPAVRRGALAWQMADAIEEAISRVVPTYREVFARAVSRSLRALAHKDLIESVEISPAGEVVLMDRTGHPLQDLAASAGERHIFAMALVAAVGDLAGSVMPVVMDTPLGRLDSEHRERILHFFSTRENQTILLSQPDEVHGKYLNQIRARIAASYRLDHEVSPDGPGETFVNQGYLPQAAA